MFTVIAVPLDTALLLCEISDNDFKIICTILTLITRSVRMHVCLVETVCGELNRARI